ncbi:integrase arm-type DNA-binding domain-containing protein [uncultured Paracoccus sp.]|uniref:tyrosine-type recombinase/integrase n=1 Tax=uncultured Paracoccus sp. TaxID=189685 RepID=UPI00262E64BA|nr:integrase arm-type DNA-binding domain-containing protein [uncultured Paracoccus sp.]
MALSDIAIRSAKAQDKPLMMNDGSGLRLIVRPSGKKTWQLRYRFADQPVTTNLGDYPRITLAMARAIRADVKDKIAQGIDPSLKEGEVTKDEQFETVAARWLSGQVPNWKPAHALRVSNRLYDDVFPELGHLRTRDITSKQVLTMLRKIEDRGALDVARRVRQTLSAIFRFAIIEELATVDPAAPVIDAMMRKPRQKHNPYLRDTEVTAFLHRLNAYSGDRVTQLGIRFHLLTMVRSQEARFAKKVEFEGKMWRIPAHRMKEGLEHLVPLSPQAQVVVEELCSLNDSEWLLPSPYLGKPISENTLIGAIYRMDYKGRLTVHGLRRTASTILNESGLFHFDAIERQLAHVPKDTVRAAYNAAQYLPKRIEMMNWWGDWIETAENRAKTDLTDLLGPNSQDDFPLLGEDVLLGDDVLLV